MQLTNSQTFLQTIRRRLAALSETPYLDAQVLLSHILGQRRSWILAHPDPALTAQQRQDIDRALDRLENGVPLPYVLGRWEFYKLDFTLTPDVLIPRPETEFLVEKALAWLRQHPTRRRCADIGTGAGCIAVTLAAHVPDAHVTATDISPEALDVAEKNAHKHGVESRISFVGGNLMNGLEGDFDLICANLPYIPTPTLRTLDVYGREPTLALDGGPEGLRLIQTLLKQSPRHLTPGGILLLEIDSSHRREAKRLAQTAFPAADVHIHPDLAGYDRLLSIQHI